VQLSGKVAIITGGSRGIGKATAKLFEKKGAKVVITSKNSKALKIAANEIGNVIPIPADIRIEKDVQKVVEKTMEKFSKIDILVNVAGILPKFKPLHKISEDEWNETMDVNLTGTFRFTKAVIPFMMKKGGSIINMSSVAGLKAFENYHADAYSASKGALVLLTKVWALEYAKYKIRFNCICSAVVETDMTKKLWLSSPAKRKKTALEHPIGRVGTVDDIASAILYFASDDSSWTTGGILTVDGGVAIK